MGSLADLIANHALWAWLALAAVFLMTELLTGSGWMLWPAAAAAGVGALAVLAPLDLPAQATVFAFGTVIATYAGRRFVIRRSQGDGPDINDPLDRLIGRHGEATCAFTAGRGRVFVDGKEWSAEVVGAPGLATGDRIEVIAVRGGAHLEVRSA
jgi:membrane protein implicated in regulation of membrane protease activity